MLKQISVFIFALAASILLTVVFGHGSMILPNQRGALSRGSKFVKYPVLDRSSVDWKMHFPAGDKSSRPGSGLRSQRRAAGRQGWVPYNPFSRHFKWRAGVCGDTLRGRDHLRGGKYYNHGYIVKAYSQGGIIDIVTAITAHHNGFFELFICNVARCPNKDISRSCFHRRGACQQLYRAGGDACESRTNTRCAPVDPNYPGRWYFPCTKYGKRERGNWISYGPNTARFRLPRDLVCEHCVLQWYWVAANTCNPPGVIEFFEGPRGPLNWGKCKGQGGAVGGYTKVQKPCGARYKRFPEEYYQCSDIRIISRSSRHLRAVKAATVRDYSSFPKEQMPVITGTNIETISASPSFVVNAAGQSHFEKGERAKAQTSMIGDLNQDSNCPTHELRDVYEYSSKISADDLVQDVVLVSGGERVLSLVSSPLAHLHGLANFSIEAVTTLGVTEVKFKVVDKITGEKMVDKLQQGKSQFYIHGISNEGPVPWSNAPLNRILHVTVTARRDNVFDNRSLHVIFAR